MSALRLCLLALACARLSGAGAETLKTRTSQLENGPITRTPSGTIRGSWMQTRRGRRFQAYRGIRYAEPPTGELRFQPPRPILQYKQEIDASAEGPACPLPAPPSYFVDEDCLMLNVYTPVTNSSQRLPVVFYIHAGGFYSMTGRSDLAGPRYLLERDLILVTINYRLATLGFLSLGDKLAPGNNGMKDQVAALKWVHRNIAAFGGDPDLVTIAGCSAGSMSVMLHMVSPMAKGLFHRAISMSAGATGKEPLAAHQRELATRQAQFLGCSTNNSKEIFDCLKTKPWRQLGDSLTKFYESGLDPIGMWSPVVEPDFGQERFLTSDPIVAIREGRLHAVPHIISRTRDEFFWVAWNILKNETTRKRLDSEWERLAPYSLGLPDARAADSARRLRQEYLGTQSLVNDASSRAGLGALYGDSIIGFPVHRMANLMCRHSPRAVYYYELAYVGEHSHYEDPVSGRPVGAAHHDDLLYLFTLSYRFPEIALDSPDSTLVDKMTALWYNFARYGEPGPRGDTPELGALAWPAMTPARREYLSIGNEFSVHRNLLEDRYKIWEELYPIEY